MAADFNERSPDAMFARILQRLDAQDRNFAEHRIEMRSTLDEIRTQARLTNGRVTSLERERWHQRGIVAAVGVFAAGAWEWITKR